MPGHILPVGKFEYQGHKIETKILTTQLDYIEQPSERRLLYIITIFTCDRCHEEAHAVVEIVKDDGSIEWLCDRCRKQHRTDQN